MNTLNSTKMFRKPLTNNALQNWYIQRVTAIAMIIAMIGIIVPCLFMLLETHDIFMVVQTSSQYIWIQIMREVFIVCACWHGLIGLRNVIMDYVKCTFKKVLLNVFLIIYLLGIVIYSFYAIWL
jgi:succinate dehydrogenase hydrophobic membrane anchor protein